MHRAQRLAKIRAAGRELGPPIFDTADAWPWGMPSKMEKFLINQ